MKYKKNKISASLASYRHYWRGEAKVGKAQPLYSKVQTPKGEVAIGDLSVGDSVFTQNGSATKVVGVFPQGINKIYELTFSDNSKTRCSEDHLWATRTRKMKSNGRGFTRIVTVKDMLDSKYISRRNGRTNAKFGIPLCKAVEFEDQPVLLDSYLLGVLIGDGYICGSIAAFSNTEEDIINNMSVISESYGCSLRKAHDDNYTYIIKKPNDSHRNPIITSLRELGLFGLKSGEKFVPDIYKYNSRNVRIEILKGLLDTDGHVSEAGQIRFFSTSQQLISDVKWIVQSLGGLATRHQDYRENKKSEYLIIKAFDFVPVSSKKHMKKFGNQEPRDVRLIHNIEFVGNEECVCIKVEDESELYLTDEFIVTHNTTAFRDLMISAYGDTKYGLLISPGNESGFTALDDIIAVRTQTWNDFVEVVDDLVENPEENEFKMVAIDTVDELVDVAIEKTLKVHYQRKGQRPKSINDALGGYGAGRKFVISIINKQIQRLENAGLGLIFIGHTKIRDIKQKNLSEPYQLLTSNLESGYDGIFKNKADIVATFYVDREISDGAQVGVERYIYFRSTDFVDAGTRFKDMPERVVMTMENYIKAFEHGVKSSMGSKISKEKLSKMKKKESDARGEKSLENSEKEKTGSAKLADVLKIPEDYRVQIEKALKELDGEMKKQKKSELEEKEVPTNYKEIEDLDVLKVILKTILS